jgi:hypothetical protein
MLRLSTLLPNLHLLQEKLLANCDSSSDQYRNKILNLEQLPYAYNSTAYSFFKIADLAISFTESALANVTNKSALIGLGEKDREKISFNIDLFLDSSRRTQNAIVPYLSLAFSKSLPGSMSDVVKKIKSGKLSFDENLDFLLLKYWGNSGAKLKSYRDLVQHHATLASDATFGLGPDGEKIIVLLLPNNPEVKNLSSLQYDNPKVHALNYLKSELFNLTKLCFWVTKMIGLNTVGNFALVMRQVFRTPLKMGASVIIEGQTPLVRPVIEDELRSMIASLMKS